MRFFTRKAWRGALYPGMVVAAAAITLGIGWMTWTAGTRLFIAEVETRTQALLSVQTATLERHLDKFRLLPPLLALRPDIQSLIGTRDRAQGERVAAVVAGMSGAQEVAFLDDTGNLIASSYMEPRYRAPAAQWFASIPLTDAFQGRLGRAYRPGAFDGAPGSYLFASGVRNGVSVAGAVMVRVGLAEVEQAWALSKGPLVAIDAGGRIVATNRADWRGKTFSQVLASAGRLSSGARATLEAASGEEAVRVGLRDGSVQEPHVMMARRLPVLDWRIVAFSNATDARSQAMKATAIAVLVCLLLSGIGWVAIERRQLAMRRMREDRLAALRLERRVRSRTKELSAANRRLAEEVREREAAEAELRNMQADLVQAAKMATLGQMSAALSHEFNQPLAAIRSNAENARQFLERGNPERTLAGLDRIIAMVERMAEISRVLKGFSRRAGTEFRSTPLKPAIDEAVMLLSPRLKQSGATLSVRHADGPLEAMAGHVRLEQVILNLLANAIDAVGERDGGAVWLSTRAQDGCAVIEVEDNGPGVAPELLSRVFDPFFTTKDIGKGLGLGLSIAYKIVHDFSGTLSVGAGARGGALFIVRLPRADQVRDAAQ
ncbi:ATP-binding protein [Stappia sp. ES.058]|uniref:sensor histidine kinase n=1 Tax=Stappia sp. ES.058 TaxID=1881061 RepID=UPI000879A5B8|nr:ATP-binding protein [Stappia sp. ES.058]SDU37295.1 two-component system, NtrC family, C4-dicarboxylate transport sensor histidine kinase DctB [Stappia sp. ES.058]